jgi:arylsulfatase A-like enzyme
MPTTGRLYLMKSRLPLLLLGVTSLITAIPLPAPGAGKPNFVVILAEGAGWNSTSVPMDDAIPGSKSELLQTPNLARLAHEGMRFAQFYAASPRCTPSRAAIFTGKSAAQLHMTFINDGRGRNGGAGADPGQKLVEPAALMELPSGELTIGDLLKRSGYATAHFGKWHVGRVSPSAHGFDESDGPTGNDGPGRNENPDPEETFAMTERGLAFMAKQAKAGKPFYLQLSHYPGRRGVEDARPETYASVRQRAGPADPRQVIAAAIIEDMDASIGMALKKIDELGITDNSYVFYTADHGANGRGANRPLSGGKGTLWEGGLRVPFLVRGPGIAAGVCSHVPATDVDLLPTIAALAGVTVPLPNGVEGGSLASVFAGRGVGAVKRPRNGLFFHFPHYDQGNDGPASALILGHEKLIKSYETGGLQLFDLSRDSAEQHDLAKENPALAARLEAMLVPMLCLGTPLGGQFPCPRGGVRGLRLNLATYPHHPKRSFAGKCVPEGTLGTRERRSRFQPAVGEAIGAKFPGAPGHGSTSRHQ